MKHSKTKSPGENRKRVRENYENEQNEVFPMDVEKPKEGPGMSNSSERVAEQKKFKMKKAKDKLKAKASSKRMTQADVDSRSSAHGGSTAPIPGGSDNNLTDWEKKYGSKL